MSGNTLGQMFRVTTFGESHGIALGAVIDGCPAGLTLSESDIQPALDRRRPGQSHVTTQRREADQVQIVSGIFEGKTTGAPIALMISNCDARSRDYESLKTVLRPGHGDYTYFKKYGHRDYRGGGRASARETVCRVAAGAVAQKVLSEKCGIQVRGYVSQIGSLCINPKHFSWESIHQNPFYCPDATQVPLMMDLIETLRKTGDSIGGRVNVQVDGMPVGLGEPVFDRLDADLAKALMSINAVKGVEIGDGFDVVMQTGSAHRDEITLAGFKTNHAGGILAGISTGQPLLMSMAFKPPSSIRIPAESINEAGEPVSVVVTGRHDPCVAIRGVVVAEAMVALVVMDHWLRSRSYG